MSDQTLTLYLTRDQLINANHRDYRYLKSKLVRHIRTTVGWHAKASLTPVEGRVRVLVTYAFPDRRSLPDAGNLAPTTKAATDGLRDARILHDDTLAYVVGEDSRIDGTSDRPGLVRITIRLEPAA